MQHHERFYLELAIIAYVALIVVAAVNLATAL